MSNTFTLMTFNIEILLELFKNLPIELYKHTINKLSDVLPLTTPELSTELNKKIVMFENIFNDVDIACIQEHILTEHSLNRNKELQPFLKEINDLQIVSTCKSHKFEWDISKSLYGNNGILANSIFVKKSLLKKNKLISVQKSSLTDIIHNRLRCYAMTTILIGNTPISIATCHLSGGRFDDIAAIRNNDTAKIKIKQIEQIIRDGYHIICGDLNTKLYNGELIDDPYFTSLYTEYIKDTTIDNKDTKETCWDRYMLWMFGLDNIFKQNGYKSVYDNAIGDTTKFGGVVDMVYYKHPLLEVNSYTKVVENVMIPPNPSNTEHTAILSDHYPIKVVFQIKLKSKLGGSYNKKYTSRKYTSRKYTSRKYTSRKYRK